MKYTFWSNANELITSMYFYMRWENFVKMLS